jgi:hypothetical protein
MPESVCRIGRLWVWFAHLHSVEDVVAVERKALFESLPYYPRGDAAVRHKVVPVLSWKRVEAGLSW